MIEAERHAAEAMTIWERRSQHEYKLDVSYLKKWIPKNEIRLDWLSNQKRSLPQSKFDAIRWAQWAMKSNCLILDTETTGRLSDPDAEVIELAIITMNGRVLYNGRFKPQYKIPKDVIAIHGITNKAVAKSPSFESQWPRIQKILAGHDVITYNANFDAQMISRSRKSEEADSPFICTFDFIAKQSPDVASKWYDGMGDSFRKHAKNPKTSPTKGLIVFHCAMRKYRIYREEGRFSKLGGSHDALGDAQLTLTLIRKMAEDSKIEQKDTRTSKM